MYDRRLSKDERRAEQRRQLLSAAAEQLCRGPTLNVSELVRRARVDRNAYYELFGDQAAVERALADHVTTRLEFRADPQLAPTPGDALRHWLKRWLAWVRDEPALARACLNTTVEALLVDAFCEHLERWSEQAVRSGLLGASPEPLRMRLLASTIAHAAELAAQRKPGELSNALAELVLRGLR